MAKRKREVRQETQEDCEAQGGTWDSESGTCSFADSQRSQEDCEAQGGTWNAETETCTMPEATDEASGHTVTVTVSPARSRPHGYTEQNDAQDRLNKLTFRLREIINKAKAEHKAGKRPSDALTAEEETNYDRLHKDMTGLETQIRSVQATKDRERALDEMEYRLRNTSPQRPAAQRQQPYGTAAGGGRITGTTEYREEFRQWLRDGTVGPTMRRALQSTSDPAGGFTVPDEFLNELIREVDDQVAVRQVSRVLQVSANAVGIPTLRNKLADATWGTELQVAAADTTMDFGNRRLQPHPLTVQLLVSKLLPLQSSIDIEGLVRSEFARAVGETEEREFMEGNGANRPLGLFFASANGLSTTRDNVTSSSSGNPTALNLINTFYSLKPQYRRNATWLFHRDRLRAIRSLQDGNSNFIWTPAGFGTAQGVVGGQPAQLLGANYIESEFAPNSTASTTGTGENSTGYVAIVGDFNAGYWITDAPGLGVNRYDQINAATNQDTYIGLFQVDGAPVLQEAFARARLST